jgi:hypothetical protein
MALSAVAKLDFLIPGKEIDFMLIKHLLIYPFWIGVNPLEEPC